MRKISWLEKIGCKPYKTPSYHLQLNGLAERMVQTVKTGLKACSQQKEKAEVLVRLHLSYHSIPSTRRWESPSVFIGRQIRAPLTMSYSTNEKVWYKKNKESIAERAEFIMQKGHNTAIIINRGKYISPCRSIKPPPVNMRSKIRKKSLQFILLMIYWNNLYRMNIRRRNNAWSSGAEWVSKLGWRSNNARKLPWL